MMKVKPEAPKIEFPCANYSLKIVGLKTANYHKWVVECMQRLSPELDPKKVQVVDSRNVTFQSIRLAVTAQSEDHLKEIHQTLMDSGKVKLVL